MRVSVFCSSSAKVNSVYFNAATRLGEILADNNISVNYGGGEVGLMGALADTMIEMKGSIKGIIPKFMVDQGWNHPKLKDMLVVDNMHERMNKMNEDIDAYIALPGGVGTLSELLETITMKQLAQILHPIVIINTANFFDPFLQMLDQMVEKQFMRDIHTNIWSVVQEPDEVMDTIKNAPVWDESKINYAPA
jgi:uncharacterized protein (TIGR00730 family)